MGTPLPTPGVGPSPDHSGGACASCALSPASSRLGLDPGRYDHVVALAGNPNTGKSTVFNALTGLRQHVGNWAGKTVARAEGGFSYGGAGYRIVDLPGTYSLLSTSTDEDVARDVLLFGRPDVVVVVVDATRLERNLPLVLQIRQITGRVVVALNLVDEARRHGITVDTRHLTRELGVPVVATAARRGEGLPDLLAAIAQVATADDPPAPLRLVHRDPALERAVAELAAQVEARFPGVPNSRWVALRLLEGDAGIEEAVRTGTLGDLAEVDGTAPLHAVSDPQERSA
ncbi:FeoB small GTPase domain-containing protein [Actinomycetospora lemnae]|uniref:FeoB small GTPase domain-containing protein n=1 Tax=Actinomycetospora lemnae TaxID=3019891 RepID=A0ABT5SMG9_9PSEU|nr:FeoB small GTPase domain-containing protein [Actinomycetospora sp. DW7H6]MDD7964035.1 FeoB small GTPase domain-containing protein [Actinomycetospora sp. DW7H6]